MFKTRKFALITGATAGIGKETARIFWEQGFSLLLVGRRQDRLEELKKELEAAPVHHLATCEIATLDVQDKEQVHQFLVKRVEILEQVEVLVNNAGLAKGMERVQDAALPDWDQMIDTNIKGLMYLTRGVLPFMLKKTSGHIVNMGSVAGRWTYPGGAVYCATKAAVKSFTEGLRMDLAGSGIRVSNIEPGMVETEFSVVRTGDQAKADLVYKGMKPLTPRDIAESIWWVASLPSHVNIQELVIYPTDQAHVGQVFRRG